MRCRRPRPACWHPRWIRPVASLNGTLDARVYQVRMIDDYPADRSARPSGRRTRRARRRAGKDRWWPGVRVRPRRGQRVPRHVACGGASAAEGDRLSSGPAHRCGVGDRHQQARHSGRPHASFADRGERGDDVVGRVAGEPVVRCPHIPSAANSATRRARSGVSVPLAQITSHAQVCCNRPERVVSFRHEEQHQQGTEHRSVRSPTRTEVHMSSITIDPQLVAEGRALLQQEGNLNWRWADLVEAPAEVEHQRPPD